MRNQDIKDMIKSAGLKLWMVAEVYGITDGNFSRKLRYELTPSERERIISIIETLKNRKEI